jgi:hypothetical protein
LVLRGGNNFSHAGNYENLAFPRDRYSRAAFPFEKRLQHCFSKNQRLTPILPKSGGQGQVFKKSEVKANSSKNRRLRPIRSKTVRKHLRFGGSKAAVKQLGAQTQPRRN